MSSPRWPTSPPSSTASTTADATTLDGDRLEDDDGDTNSNAGGLRSGRNAYKFLRGLSSSPAFVRDVWHRRPLLIRAADTGGWVGGAFTVERDLRLIGGSYINGHRTADVLRNGTKTDTWEFKSLKDDPARKTTWEEVEDALSGGTIYFNTAGSLWPNLGALCRLTAYAFGIPTNVNVYVTPPGVTTSVPPHTDRQDVLVLQTAGSKRWRVYAPPSPRKKGVDPLNRGKASDVLTAEELGRPLIDAVVRKGDVLYVPAGFPHGTDTCTVIDDESSSSSEAEAVFDETSVHLTMGLDTHVWMPTYAHLRWSLLQRTGKDFKLDIKDDSAYWKAMEAVPIGFLGGEAWEANYDKMKQGGPMDGAFRARVADDLRSIMVALEPDRWKESKESGSGTKGCDEESSSREELPTAEEFNQVVEYMCNDHLVSLMELQDEMFTNIDPHSDDTIVKAYHCTQKQNGIMEAFGKFSKSEAMERSFARSRAERDSLAKGSNVNTK